MSYMRSHSLGAPIDLYISGRAHQDPRNRAATLSPDLERDHRARLLTPAPMYERYAPYPARHGPEGMTRNQPERGEMDGEIVTAGNNTTVCVHHVSLCHRRYILNVISLFQSLEPHGHMPQTPRTQQSHSQAHNMSPSTQSARQNLDGLMAYFRTHPGDANEQDLAMLRTLEQRLGSGRGRGGGGKSEEVDDKE